MTGPEVPPGWGPWGPRPPRYRRPMPPSPAAASAPIREPTGTPATAAPCPPQNGPLGKNGTFGPKAYVLIKVDTSDANWWEVLTRIKMMARAEGLPWEVCTTRQERAATLPSLGRAEELGTATWGSSPLPRTH